MLNVLYVMAVTASVFANPVIEVTRPHRFWKIPGLLLIQAAILIACGTRLRTFAEQWVQNNGEQWGEQWGHSTFEPINSYGNFHRHPTLVSASVMAKCVPENFEVVFPHEISTRVESRDAADVIVFLHF